MGPLCTSGVARGCEWGEPHNAEADPTKVGSGPTSTAARRPPPAGSKERDERSALVFGAMAFDEQSPAGAHQPPLAVRAQDGQFPLGESHDCPHQC